MNFVVLSAVVLVFALSIGRRLLEMTRGNNRTNLLRAAAYPVAVLPAAIVILFLLVSIALRTLLTLFD